jgi:serine/threonine-protein kinase
VPLKPGQRLGPYEVVAALGVGGMGEVYRARDLTLNREVALKVVPDSVIVDVEVAVRFRREAQMLASLNHPNIAQIYGFEDSGVDGGRGMAALVLELVEGPTLADRIAVGALDVGEVLPIARQIAEALDAAHQQGIIHRDLKPANIKLRPDGTVKVLDFGLAKAMDLSAAPNGADLPTLPPRNLTQFGVILGTPAYMSPEQAAGRPVDRRCDLWAFGVVLLEMLTGRPVFPGETATHVMAAVLRAEPEWAGLPPETPEPLRRLLRRCLEKDPRRRLDSAAGARIELDDALVAPESGVAAPATTIAQARRSLGAPSLIAAAIVGGVVVGALAWWFLRAPAQEAEPVTRFVLAPPPAQALTLSIQSTARDFAVAPDGSFLVYRGGDHGQLIMRWFDRLEPSPLPGVSDAAMPFVSPDSRWIGYVEADLTLKKVAATGGTPVTLARLPVWPRGGSWVDDDTIVIGTNSPTTGLLRVPAGGGEPTVLTTPDRAKGEEGHILPSGLPGGGAVLFTIGAAQPSGAQVALLDLKTGQQTTLLRGARDAQYVTSGHLVFLAGRSMSAVRFDVGRRTVVGEPVRMLDGVASTPTSAMNIAVSRTGTLVFVPGGASSPARRTLAWMDRRGQQTPIQAPVRPYESVRLSPDGTRVALSIRDQENDIWTWDLARQTLSRVTFDPDIDLDPVWSPDGRRLIYASTRTGVYNLYARDVDGGTADTRLTTSANTQLPDAVTPDGLAIVSHEVRPQTGSDLVRASLAPGATGAQGATDLVSTPFEEWNAEVSPDGRWLAYQSDESGRDEVYVRPMATGTTPRWQVSAGGGVQPVWTRGGRELIFLDAERRLTSIAVDAASDGFRGGPPATISAARVATPMPWRAYDVTADGQRFLVLDENRASLADAPAPAFVVVQHWFEELRHLVPAK